MSEEVRKSEIVRGWLQVVSGFLMPTVVLSLGFLWLQKVESIKQKEVLKTELNKAKVQELLKTIEMIEGYSFDKRELAEKQALTEQYLTSMRDQEERFKAREALDAEFSKILKQTNKLRILIDDSALSDDISDYLHRQALYSMASEAYSIQKVSSLEERMKGMAQYGAMLGKARTKMAAHLKRLTD